MEGAVDQVVLVVTDLARDGAEHRGDLLVGEMRQVVPQALGVLPVGVRLGLTDMEVICGLVDREVSCLVLEGVEGIVEVMDGGGG